jgi:hypothetical protein
LLIHRRARAREVVAHVFTNGDQCNDESLNRSCHLTALGPLSSCIYTTSSPSTLSRPIYIHLFTVTEVERERGRYRSLARSYKTFLLRSNTSRIIADQMHFGRDGDTVSVVIEARDRGPLD